MTRKQIRKAVFIVFLILLSVMLIMPTVGRKDMEVKFLNSASSEQIDAVKNRFNADGFTVSEGDSENILLISGRGINDAVKNEIRIFEGVDDARILKTWVEDKLMAKKINLGLDLQGGMHLILQANYGKVIQKYSDDIASLDRRLNDPEGKLSDDEKKQLTEYRKYITDNVLEESGNETGIYSIREQYKNEMTQQALELLRNRVDKFGVAEPSIRPSGKEAIEIQLPGIKDINSVKNALGSTGSLEYRLVDDSWSEKAGAKFQEKQAAGFPADWNQNIKFLNDLAAEISAEIHLPEGFQIMFVYERIKDSKKIAAQYPLALEKVPAVVGTDISEASVNRDEYGQIVVSFRTTAEGAAKFADATKKENRGRRLAIVLDDKIRNAPRVNEQISTGSGQITGGFTHEEATTLARIIKEGALPVDLQIIEERVVGPSLGQDSINDGVNAAIIGLILVMVFMIIYYKAAGIIADFALVLNMVFMLAVLSLLGFTLTLPGIAGFVLTVGMAVDANVIIYERIKEELALGKSVRLSITTGYEKAFWTIFDANLTTLIAAFILFQFGTAQIKGFAVTLFIGVLSSMFTALYITRFVYEIISLNKKLKKLSI